MTTLRRWRFLTLLSFAVALATTAFGQYAISTIAGGGPPNGAVATSIALSSVNGPATDSSGNLYLPDRAQNRVYKVAMNGAVTTVAGNGTIGFSGDNSLATSAQLNSPQSVAIDNAGNLYIADSGNYRIRKVSGGVITTVAGNGAYGYSGDSGPATSAQIGYSVNGVAVDSAGNLYIADTSNYRIRKVSGGVITTVAGNGAYGYSGDSGPATSAQIAYPEGIAADSTGNLYIADSNNYRIRKVSAGVITTVAGNGSYGYSGDNGLATSAQIDYPAGVAVDSAGNFYFSDGSYRVRKVSGGVITTVAGGGGGCPLETDSLGDGCPAASAAIDANGVAVDGEGNLYIADTGNYRIRKVTGGVITTVAGNGTPDYSGDNGAATSAQLEVSGVAVDNSGDLYIADPGDYRIRKVAGGVISTTAGTGSSGYAGDNGPAASAPISNANAVAVDTLGNLYIADSSRIREVSGGVITTVAGNESYGYSGDNGPATSATITQASGITVDSAGNLYIADSANGRIRKVSGGVIRTFVGAGPPDGSAATAISFQSNGTAVDSLGDVYVGSAYRVYKVAANGTVTSVAGNGTSGYSGDNGLATSAQIDYGGAVAVDSAGNLYIADFYNCRIREVSGGVITTVAGNGSCGYSGDSGPATGAEIDYPESVAIDSAGNLYIADADNYVVRKVSGGVITTVAGNGSYGYSGDTGPAISAQIGYPEGVAVDSSGNLYIADTNHYVVRKVSGGVITTVAGNGSYGYSGDNGPATSAQISYPYGVAVDSSGNLYIADIYNEVIRKVSGGVITTVAGSGLYGYSGDNGAATSAQISYPQGVAVDSAGNLYIADSGNYRIRKVSGGVITTIAGNGFSSYSGDGGPAINAQLYDPSGLAVDNSGNLYISDTANNRVRMVSSSGTITTFAGGGTQPYGNGEQATSTSLQNPGGLAVDAAHNVYIVDGSDGFGNIHILRKVSGGVINSITSVSAISTYTGLGSYPYSGGGGVAVDSGGDIYLADPANSRVLLLGPGTVITNVTSSTSNGTFGAGAQIAIQVTFSGSVIVTGTPQLALNSGGIASYASGSGTSTLTFNYTVLSGQSTAHLDYGSASALTLNGGTILDSASKPAVLTLPSPGSPGSLGANKSFVIVAGAVTHFSVTAPATATAGVPIQFTVQALDGNNVIASFSGTVHFTSTDPAASLLANIMLNGVGTFSASLVTAGTQTITVSDLLATSIAGTSGSIAVSPPSGLRYVPVTPCRVVDTRNAAGPLGGPAIAGGTSRDFVVPGTCGIPSTAQAFSLNVTVVPHGILGYLTIWPTGQNQPLVSTLNSIDGRVKADASILPAGAGGAVSVFVTNDTDVILDISGYFVPAATSGAMAFYPMAPCRLVDTRNGGTALTGGTISRLAILSDNCGVPAMAQAYSLNFTVVPPGPLGYLTVYPSGVPQPVVSTLNDLVGTVTANAAIVPASTAGSIDVFVTNTTDLVVDINGYFAPAGTGGLSFYALPPCRVLDTRNAGSPTFSGAGAIDVDMPGSVCGGTAAAQAYVLNATVVPQGTLGYLTLWPQGAAQPVVSTLNASDGAITSNMAIVPTSNTRISAFASNKTDLILDMSGYFAP